MIKLRLEGKEKEILECIKELKHSDAFEVLSISKVYSSTTRESIYKRCFVEIDFKKAGEHIHE